MILFYKPIKPSKILCKAIKRSNYRLIKNTKNKLNVSKSSRVKNKFYLNRQKREVNRLNKLNRIKKHEKSNVSMKVTC